MTDVAGVKERTIALYESLPQEKESRMKCTKVRDEVIQLNYPFFGYIASSTFINNSSIEYEDKLQSALMHFCECWWWYKWKGDESHKGYRQDISFSSFFKLRIGEMIERELNEVKYSVRRSLCMEVGEQLHKHWGQVKYEDLAKVKLPAEKLIALKAIFGTLYTANLEDHELYIPAKVDTKNPFEFPDEKYDDYVSLLIHDMIVYEEPLTEDNVRNMADIYSLPFHELWKYKDKAEAKLYSMIQARLDTELSWEE